MIRPFEQCEIRPDPHFTKGINAIVRLESEYLVGNGCAVSLSNTAFAVVTAGLKGSARRISADTGGGGSKDGEALCQVPCGFALPTCGGAH